MTPLLEDKVAAYVADHPGQTVEQIAINIGHRRAAVQEVLNCSLFLASQGPRHSTVYSLQGRSRTPGTHKERVLRLLQDGQPHSHMEGYRLNVMLHSRVADLRRDGYDIRCWRDGDLYMYQLVSLDEAAVTRAGGLAVSSSDPGGTDGLLRARPTSEQDAGIAQLSLTGPAFRRSAAA